METDCDKYGHLPVPYDIAFWCCKVCDKELEFYTDEEIKRIKQIT